MGRHTPRAHLPSLTLGFLPELTGANTPSTGPQGPPEKALAGGL